MNYLLVMLVFVSNILFGFIGFGLTGGLNTISHPSGLSPLIVNQNNVGSFTYNEFKNPVSVGGYLYIDALPVVDLDLELNFKFIPYDFTFNNNFQSMDETFGWLSSSIYMTVQKELAKKTIPFIAKVKVFAGGGFNHHSSTPMVNQDMLEIVMGGSDQLENGTFDSTKMIDYLNENKIDISGVHVQLGTQFKIFTFDSMLIYRYVFSNGITPDNDAFSNINLRLGFGL